MKKFIVIAIMALAVCGVSFAEIEGGDVVKTIALTTTGTSTADATYVVPAGERLSLYSVYQGITTETNTCLVKRILRGLAAAQATTFVTLTAVTNTSAIQNVGEGLGDVTTAPLILMEGDTLWLDASGAAASNVVYKIIVKRTKQ
jgi:hypothetical protein